MLDIVFKVYGPCNRRCPYCVDLMQGPSRDLVYKDFSEDIFDKFEFALQLVRERLPFNFNCVYHLVGGEPSFWPIEIQNKFISIMAKYSKHWIVPTNAYDIKAPILNRKDWAYNVHATGPFNGLNSGMSYTVSVIEDCRQEKDYWKEWGIKPTKIIPDQTQSDTSKGGSPRLLVPEEELTYCRMSGLRTIQIDVPSQKWTPCCHDWHYLDLKDFSFVTPPQCPRECIPPVEYK